VTDLFLGVVGVATPTRRVSWRVVLLLAIAGGLAAGFLAQDRAATAASLERAGPELTMLLRFMAVVKGGAGLAVCALVAWRLGRATPVGLALVYVAAAAGMAAAPILVWGMVHVGIGALAFHAGWLLLLGTTLADRDGRGLVGAAGRGWLGRR
jgi:hypothetical protein